VQHIENIDAFYEDMCWDVASKSAMAVNITWDVIHFNEGLHSLYPRVNTSAELQQWAAQLLNFTRHMQATQPSATLIYAPMTPYPPGWWLNPANYTNDVELKNALAVQTVQSAGVTRINDLYSVITDFCGPVPYKNCSYCDDESQYHPGIQCGFHYVSAGYEALAASTVASLRAALADRRAGTGTGSTSGAVGGR
jgi:hypothetical protein